MIIEVSNLSGNVCEDANKLESSCITSGIENAEAPIEEFTIFSKCQDVDLYDLGKLLLEVFSVCVYLYFCGST